MFWEINGNNVDVDVTRTMAMYDLKKKKHIFGEMYIFL